jgi:hypothetical protein
MDSYEQPEISPAQVERLKDTKADGDAIRSFCLHPGFKLYKAALEEKIADRKNTWLRGSDEEAKSARMRAQGIQEALDELKKFILSGDRAGTVLTQVAQVTLSQPQAELQV